MKEMMTLICPNCRHPFPMPGCCNPASQTKLPSTMQQDDDNYFSGLLVPRGYNHKSECIINSSTNESSINDIDDSNHKVKLLKKNSDHKLQTTCDLSNGTLTITPSIQSGGFLIETTDSGVLIKAPKIEIKSNNINGSFILDNKNVDNNDNNNHYKTDEMWVLPTPSGCQELPGIRRNSTIKSPLSCSLTPSSSSSSTSSSSSSSQAPPPPPVYHNYNYNINYQDVKRNNSYNSDYPSDYHKNYSSSYCNSSTHDDNSLKIHATVQLPKNISGCTVNITATTTSTTNDTFNNKKINIINRNNFNGGGIVQRDDYDHSTIGQNNNNNNCDNSSPTTPISWITSMPWDYNSDLQNKNNLKLGDIKRLLQTSGWYYEGLSWQQSETLLKNTPVGTWLMRDSSDHRYTFAVSVQTPRGPTSVRVLWIGKFRLDAEPKMASNMPTFNCPIEMLEFYVNYSNKNDDKSHVWIDSSGKVYSQIYLSQPLSKSVKSLSHLARLSVNKHKINIENLPSPIKSYIDEYPYTF